MKYYLFNRESNDFSDILKDKSIKSAIRHQFKFRHHLMLGLEDDDKIGSYLTIKYGEDIIPFNNISPDRSPIMGKDYVPKRKTT